MRQAGEVIRADVGMLMDGRPKGNGTVVFVNPEDARNAIGMMLYEPADQLLTATQRCSTASIGSATSSKSARYGIC